MLFFLYLLLPNCLLKPMPLLEIYFINFESYFELYNRNAKKKCENLLLFIFFIYLQSSKNSELFKFLSLLSTHQIQLEPPVFSLLSTFLQEINWKIENVNISAQ